MIAKTFLAGLLLLISSLGFTQPYFFEVPPEAQGVSSDAILDFILRLEAETDAVHSFMILRNGQLISKGWWEPYGSNIPHVMYSLSKSFTSTAVGFAVQEKLLSLDDLVISFFPDKAPKEPSWHWDEMRIRDLLTMTTGHTQEPRIRETQDWVKYFLESKVELLPGSAFKYNSMATYMLSAIITKVTGEKLVDYLDPRFFQPLGIKKPEWDEDPMGINTGGWGLHITTESIAKLGQFYLQKGRWEGRQLLTEEWVEMATSKQVSNGSDPDSDWMQGYGFQFWRCRYNAYRGDGAMGQFCIVLPDQNAVIAITSGLYDMAGVMNIIWETLLPAMKNNPLPLNLESYRVLVNKTDKLTLKTTKGEKTSPLSKKVSKTFTMEENNAGLKAITLNFQGKSPQIHFSMETDTEILKIGWNTFLKNEINNHLPYADGFETGMATTGAWLNDSTYQMLTYAYESPARIYYTLSFTDNTLLLKTKLDHALFGRRDVEEIIGQIK